MSISIKMPVNGGPTAPQHSSFHSTVLRSFRLLLNNRQNQLQAAQEDAIDNVFIAARSSLLEHPAWGQRVLERALPGPGADEFTGEASESDEGKEDDYQVDESMDITEPGSCSAQMPPQPSSWLHCGQSFTGFQRLTPQLSSSTQEDWSVTLTIHDCDWEKGWICGIMEARNVPRTDTPIITYWEGEIINNTSHTFFTDKWGASHEIDMDHWSKFGAGFSTRMRAHVLVNGGRYDMADHSHIFMRLKEQAFVNVDAQHCGLSITGFYYVSLDRQTGSLQGYYHDPQSTPYQYLELKPDAPHGCAFGSVALA